MESQLGYRLVRLRFVILAFIHLAIFAAAYTGAFLLRFDLGELTLPERFWDWTPQAFAALALSKLVMFAVFRQFSGWWRYVSIDDLLGITQATIMGTLLGAAVIFALGLDGFPRSIPVLDGFLTLCLLGLLRVSIRLLRERVWQHGHASAHDARSVRTLIAGTGPNAESLLREINRSGNLNVHVLGFLADARAQVGTRLSGTPIVGSLDNLPELAHRYDIEQVIVALDEESSDKVRQIVTQCNTADVKHRVLPTTDALLQGTISYSNIREVDLRDLLGRPPVRLENDSLARLISGKTILVTGAGGSIGSELCRQVARFGPSQLVLFEQAENPLFHLERALSAEFPDVNLRPIVGDIYDSERIHAVMQHTHPSVVLHAAAHKHVPLMELNPSEAIKNNIIGTLNVVSAAQQADAERFVLISTDKAVNPTSVMGASKRVSEMLIQAMSPRSQTKLAAVRFGNVLGSNGSVIPIFKDQIQRGGPVTVTHPEMQRFFMTIPEASQLVLQAATYSDGGDIFVLDMGDPVYILDIARDLIRLSGLEPELDIPIKFSGIRPGEKLFEELATDSEEQVDTPHPRIFRSTAQPGNLATVRECAMHLEKLARAKAPAAQLRKALFDALNKLECNDSIDAIKAATDEHLIVSFESAAKR